MSETNKITYNIPGVVEDIFKMIDGTPDERPHTYQLKIAENNPFMFVGSDRLVEQDVYQSITGPVRVDIPGDVWLREVYQYGNNPYWLSEYNEAELELITNGIVYRLHGEESNMWPVPEGKLTREQSLSRWRPSTLSYNADRLLEGICEDGWWETFEDGVRKINLSSASDKISGLVSLLVKEQDS